MLLLLARPVFFLWLVSAVSAALGQGPVESEEVGAERQEVEEEEQSAEERDREDRARRRSMINYHARGRCRLDWSMTPKRLLPGQVGVLRVMMVLESRAVMESGDSLQVAQKAPVGHLSVGELTLGPPRLSRMAKAYEGQLVYDDWAQLEFPVTMALDAPLGSMQEAGLEVLFELHDGNSGTSMGRYHQLVRLKCEVGSVPDPEVVGPRRGAAALVDGSVGSRPSVAQARPAPVVGHAAAGFESPTGATSTMDPGVAGPGPVSAKGPEQPAAENSSGRLLIALPVLLAVLLVAVRLWRR